MSQQYLYLFCSSGPYASHVNYSIMASDDNAVLRYMIDHIEKFEWLFTDIFFAQESCQLAVKLAPFYSNDDFYDKMHDDADYKQKFLKSLKTVLLAMYNTDFSDKLAMFCGHGVESTCTVVKVPHKDIIVIPDS